MANATLALASLVLLIVGPDATLASSLHQEQLNVSEQLSALRRELVALRTEIIEEKIRLTLSQKQREKVSLDPTQPRKYRLIQTDIGAFLISLEEVQSYLDGYRIILNIGNTSSATYVGFELTLEWGPRSPDEIDIDKWIEWQESLRSKTTSFTDRLEPATWNSVELIVAPAAADRVAHLAVSMRTNTVSLRPGR